MIYGYVICKEPIELYIWDGSLAKLAIKVGDRFDITYVEYNGTLGLTLNGIEVCCSHDERSKFDEYWNKEDGE